MRPANPRSVVRGATLALAAAAALAGSVALGSAALAQIGARDEPIDITANGLELIDAQRVQVWSGAVEAVQGPNRLRTNTLRVYHAGSPGGGGQQRQAGGTGFSDWGDAERMVAEGDVFFLTPESVARGNNGVYDLVREVVTITGDVILTRGESVVKGDKLVIDVASGRSTLDSNVQGRGTNRVRGVFYPEERAAGAAAAPRAATPRAAPSAPTAAPTPARPAATTTGRPPNPVSPN